MGAAFVPEINFERLAHMLAIYTHCFKQSETSL